MGCLPRAPLCLDPGDLSHSLFVHLPKGLTGSASLARTRPALFLAQGPRTWEGHGQACAAPSAPPLHPALQEAVGLARPPSSRGCRKGSARGVRGLPPPPTRPHCWSEGRLGLFLRLRPQPYGWPLPPLQSPPVLARVSLPFYSQGVKRGEGA